MSSTRQLAAIMFTDIVGYTALMGSDERKTMELVRRNKEVQKPLVEKHKGVWLKELGDGTISSFSTALDAINCAIDIQKALYDDQTLKLRIGIHLGDIMLEDGDVYGDGVNIASRLESIAEPGGIYISDSVQKAIRGSSDIQYALLGELELKNVDYPVKTYALRGEFLPQPKKTDEKHLSGRLWAEIRRRNVPRAVLAYLALAFIIYSLTNFAGIGATNVYIIYGVLVLGIPIAIYTAWNYERSPEGFVKVTSRKAWENPFSDTQKKPFTGNGIIIILLLAIVILTVYPKISSPGILSKSPNASYMAAGNTSIAVLPFDNLSNDSDQQYFSDGIQEDILNHLAKIPDLHVKSRSSTLQYRENRPAIAQIGEELNVNVILEGSVRKSSNMVRINAQLIDVETDDHIWSETYDRELTEVFAIQSEVAMEIARILEVKLAPGKDKDMFTTGTDDITAYDYYLRARELYSNLNSISNFSLSVDTKSIIELLQQAISMDPGFAEAYALLSRVLYNRGYLYPREIWLDSSLALANRAIELGPDVADGYTIRALITNWSLGENEKAGKDYEKAYELEPNDPYVLTRLGEYLIENNEPERGVPLIIKSIELSYNKKDPQYYLQWGNIYRDIGEFDKAKDLYGQAQKLAPEWNVPKNQLGFLYTLEGDYPTAIDYYIQAGNKDNIAWTYYRAGNLDKAEEHWLLLLEGEQNLEDTTAYFSVRQRLGMVKWDKGEKDEAMKYFDQQIKLNQRDIDQNQIPVWIGSLTSSYYDLAVTKAYIGETEQALDIIANENILWADPLTMTWWIDNEPMFESVRNDARFISVADEVRYKAEAAEEVYRRVLSEREANEELKLRLDK